jgi:hypothetical protein
MPIKSYRSILKWEPAMAGKYGAILKERIKDDFEIITLSIILLYISHGLMKSSTGLGAWLELLIAIIEAIANIIWEFRLFMFIFLILLYLFFYFSGRITFYLIGFLILLIIGMVFNSWQTLYFNNIIKIIIIEFILIYLSKFLRSLINDLPKKLQVDLCECNYYIRTSYKNRSGWLRTSLKILCCSMNLFLFQLKNGIMKLKETVIVGLYSINAFLILSIFLASFLGQDFDTMIIILSTIIYFLAILDYINNYENNSDLIVSAVSTAFGGSLTSILASDLYKDNPYISSIMIYIYLSIIFIYILYTNVKKHILKIKNLDLKALKTNNDIYYISIWRNNSLKKIKLFYLISIILIVIIHFIPPMTLGFELSVEESLVDLSNTSLNDLNGLTVNNITAIYGSKSYLFTNPAILLTANSDCGLKMSFDPPLLLPGHSSKVKITAGDISINQCYRKFAHVNVSGNFILFNEINCSEKVTTLFKIKPPNVVLLESDKESPRIAASISNTIVTKEAKVIRSDIKPKFS